MTQRGDSGTGASVNGMISDVRYAGLRLPDDLHAWLTALAERERRSLNSQVIVILERVRAEMEGRERDDRPQP
jgi:hypothetical protein